MLRGHYWARLFRQYGHEPRLMAASLYRLIVWPENQEKMMQLMLGYL